MELQAGGPSGLLQPLPGQRLLLTGGSSLRLHGREIPAGSESTQNKPQSIQAMLLVLIPNTLIFQAGVLFFFNVICVPSGQGRRLEAKGCRLLAGPQSYIVHVYLNNRKTPRTPLI